jgi:hypothetical protein
VLLMTPARPSRETPEGPRMWQMRDEDDLVSQHLLRQREKEAMRAEDVA